jgi:hypothetical protein
VVPLALTAIRSRSALSHLNQLHLLELEQRFVFISVFFATLESEAATETPLATLGCHQPVGTCCRLTTSDTVPLRYRTLAYGAVAIDDGHISIGNVLHEHTGLMRGCLRKGLAVCFNFDPASASISF